MASPPLCPLPFPVLGLDAHRDGEALLDLLVVLEHLFLHCRFLSEELHCPVVRFDDLLDAVREVDEEAKLRLVGTHCCVRGAEEDDGAALQFRFGLGQDDARPE